MKYIIVMQQVGLMMTEIPIIIPQMLDHNTLVMGCEVIGAGFCSVDWQAQKVTTYGRSVTLNCGPSPADARLLEKLLFAEY